MMKLAFPQLQHFDIVRERPHANPRSAKLRMDIKNEVKPQQPDEWRFRKYPLILRMLYFATW
jgi:hypothetical protein